MIVSPLASTSTLKYEIAMDVFVGGKKVSSPRVITNIGETASITQTNGESGFGFEVQSQESTFNGESMIHLKLQVDAIDAQGAKTVLAKPEILTLEGQEAEVTVGGKDEDRDLRIVVKARRRL